MSELLNQPYSSTPQYLIHQYFISFQGCYFLSKDSRNKGVLCQIILMSCILTLFNESALFCCQVSRDKMRLMSTAAKCYYKIACFIWLKADFTVLLFFNGFINIQYCFRVCFRNKILLESS